MNWVLYNFIKYIKISYQTQYKWPAEEMSNNCYKGLEEIGSGVLRLDEVTYISG